jgi:hypothetical protein
MLLKCRSDEFASVDANLSLQTLNGDIGDRTRFPSMPPGHRMFTVCHNLQKSR